MKIAASQQVTGTFGQFWWDNELVMEVETFEAKVTPKREESQIGLDIDSVLCGLAGEGTFTVKKFYTRGKDKLLEAWKRGEDPRSTFIAKQGNPNSSGKQSERVSISNVWFNELVLIQFEKGTPSKEEFSFGFPPSDASFVDVISA